MNIRGWSLQKRMVLPDWCFGSKWWIGDYIATTAANAAYFFFRDLPPDNFVVWDVIVSQGGYAAALKIDLTLCLCREAPVSGNIKTLTRLLRQFGTPGQAYDMHFPPNSFSHLGPMKTLVEANNDGIGGVVILPSETANCELSIAVLVSALPTEVPEWVVSGLAGRQ